MINPITIGKIYCQPNINNWSNLKRGKEALNHNIINIKGKLKKTPKNNIENKVDKVNILVYSPKKKYAKLTPPCSVIKPATNSLSASGRSKGALLDSAIEIIINKKPTGNKVKKFIPLADWFI